MSSNDRAASAISSSSTGRSPSVSVSDSFTGSRFFASCGRRSVRISVSSCSYRSAPRPNSRWSIAARYSVGDAEDRGLADLLGELLAGHRPVVVGDQGEVLPHPAVGHEVPADRRVAVPLRVQADPDRDRLAGAGVAELQPYVADRVLAAAVQQVGLHRPVLGRERVEPLGVDPAVEHEREEDLERLGLAGTVRAAQHEPAAGEAELLVAVVPQVDDPGAGGLESGHGFAGSLIWAVTPR